jgi:hypothetical protein
MTMEEYVRHMQAAARLGKPMSEAIADLERQVGPCPAWLKPLFVRTVNDELAVRTAKLSRWERLKLRLRSLWS